MIAGVRTPIGRYGGALSGVRPDDLAAVAIRAAVERAGVRPEEIEDVYFGAANQAGEDNRNVARMAALLAGLPESVGRRDRQPALRVGARRGRVGLSRGDRGRRRALRRRRSESMSRAPFVTAKPDKAFPRGDRDALRHDARLAVHEPEARGAMFPPESMGETGENVAEQYGVSREDQDAFAL